MFKNIIDKYFENYKDLLEKYSMFLSLMPNEKIINILNEHGDFESELIDVLEN